jgi:hypothetical protein
VLVFLSLFLFCWNSFFLLFIVVLLTYCSLFRLEGSDMLFGMDLETRLKREADYEENWAEQEVEGTPLNVVAAWWLLVVCCYCCTLSLSLLSFGCDFIPARLSRSSTQR